MQPAEGVKFVHTAITRDVRAVEAMALAADGDEALVALDARVAFLARVVAAHTRGEEIGLYEELEKRAPHVGAGYLWDHVDEASLFDTMRRLISEARAGGGLAPMRRHAIALSEHVVLHVRKENELIVPLVISLFTPPEQGALAGKMVSTFTPEDMKVLLPWLVGHLDAGDRLAYLGMMQAVAPPERFALVKEWVRGGVSEETWAPLGEQFR